MRRVAMMGSVGWMALGVGCAEPKVDFDAPELQPPVVDATPEGFAQTTARSYRAACSTVAGGGSELIAEEIQGRFFCGGPSDPAYRLGMTDGRLEEYERRNNEDARGRPCVGEVPQAWDLTEMLPSPEGSEDYSFVLNLSCQEDMGGDTGLKVFFGMDDEALYLAEVQQGDGTEDGAPALAVLAKAPRDGNSVEVWVSGLGDLSDGSHANYFHLFADRSTSSLELSMAAMSQDSGTGFARGAYMKSDGERLYLDGVRDQPSTTVEEARRLACVNAETLAAEGTDDADMEPCETAGMDVPSRVLRFEDVDLPEQGIQDILALEGLPADLSDFNNGGGGGDDEGDPEEGFGG